jgi:hypothetical protein
MITEPQRRELVAAFEKLDGLTREGSRQRAAELVDLLAGLDRDRLAAAARILRTRRHGRKSVVRRASAARSSEK